MKSGPVSVLSGVTTSLRKDPRAFFRKSLHYPTLYISALTARRQFRQHRSLEDALAFARDFRWEGGRLRPVQATAEILWLLDLLRQERPATVLEIGTATGGTLFLWTRVARDDARLVSMDMCPLGALGRHSAFAVLCRGFARAEQRIELIFNRDSHEASTRDEVTRLLGNRSVDFLFIDGDHSYEGVSRDFELYAALVRAGGIVAFHDVAPRISAGTGVPRFWNEFKTTHETMEIVAASEPSYGIGVWKKPK